MPEGINASFLDEDLDLTVFKERWGREGREACDNQNAIVEAQGLKSGDRIADVGAGTGLFLTAFSEAVGAQGLLYAADISPRFVEYLEQRKQAEGLANVRPHVSGEATLGLPADSVDVIFVCDAYHHFEQHQTMLASFHSALSQGGFLNLLDFERIPGVSSDWVMGHVRAGKDQVRAEVEAAGFVFVEQVHLPELQENYYLRFTKA